MSVLKHFTIIILIQVLVVTIKFHQRLISIKADHYIDIGYDRVGDKVIFVGGSSTGSYYNVGTLSGSSITWGTAQQLNSASTSSGGFL